MLTIDQLIREVGFDAFQPFADRAWETAAGTGMRAAMADRDEEIAQRDFDLASDLVERIWESPEDPRTKIGLTMELYRRAPCFTFLNEVCTHFLDELPQGLEDFFWLEIRQLLSIEDARLADPAAYLLWCGPFEDSDEVESVWNLLVSDDVPDTALRRLLVASGPVPYALKRCLYIRLLADARWHYSIYRSLLHSCHDVYGQVDREDALDVLAQLCLELPPDEVDHLRKLEAALSASGLSDLDRTSV